MLLLTLAAIRYKPGGNGFQHHRTGTPITDYLDDCERPRRERERCRSSSGVDRPGTYARGPLGSRQTSLMAKPAEVL